MKEFDTYIVVTKDITKEEIEKLKEYHLPIIFTDDSKSYYDEVGGYHESAMGWNPNGKWCGECTAHSCANCPSKDKKVENE